MKITEISWARTYNHNYQSYRASASAKLEDWETDIDACYDNLKQIVREQIGKQCSDYKGLESDEVLSLRDEIEVLRRERTQVRRTFRQAKTAVNEQKSDLQELSSLTSDGLAMLLQLISVLNSNGFGSDPRLITLEEIAEKIRRFSPNLDELDDKPKTDTEDESLIPM